MPSIPFRLYEQPWPEGEYRLVQLGFVVDDVVHAAGEWARVFGVGPFQVLPTMDVSCTYRGEPSAMTLQVGVAQAGPVQVELIAQHCDRPSVFRDLVTRGDTAFHQVCTLTSRYDEKKAYFAGLGYEMTTEIVVPGNRVAYFATFDDFGFVTEVAEDSPAFRAHLEAMSRTAAEWDGHDPVRILTRDGYRTP
jgi:hypothetical protein